MIVQTFMEVKKLKQMDTFKETPRKYDASEVDSEIAILTQSRDFWKKKAEELELQLNQRRGKKDG